MYDLEPHIAVILMFGSIFFYCFEHPLAMSLGLIVQATLIGVVTARLAACPWYSYILFIIFVGALLVLFIYVATLASNDIFAHPERWASILARCTFVFICVFGLLWAWRGSHYFRGHPSNHWEIFRVRCFDPEMMASPEIKMFVWKPISKPFTILIMWFLLLALFVAASITRHSLGPLREKAHGSSAFKSIQPSRWPGAGSSPRSSKF